MNEGEKKSIARHRASTAAQDGPRTVRAVPPVLLEVVGWLLILSGTCVSGCSWWAMRVTSIREMTLHATLERS